MQLHPGPAARGGDVLQTQARSVPRPCLPLRAGPRGQVSQLSSSGSISYLNSQIYPDVVKLRVTSQLSVTLWMIRAPLRIHTKVTANIKSV